MVLTNPRRDTSTALIVSKINLFHLHFLTKERWLKYNINERYLTNKKNNARCYVIKITLQPLGFSYLITASLVF